MEYSGLQRFAPLVVCPTLLGNHPSNGISHPRSFVVLKKGNNLHEFKLTEHNMQKIQYN
jgi:hypothetical protein